jgi:hypothetical protein
MTISLAKPFVDPTEPVWIGAGSELLLALGTAGGVVGVLTMIRLVLVVTCPFGNV